MDNTANLGLRLPAGNDYADVADLNYNFEQLDAAMAAARAAEEYDDGAAYSVGDYCIWDGKLHKCVAGITTGEVWNAAHWTETTVDMELKALYTILGGKAAADHTHTPAQIGAEPSGSAAAVQANLNAHAGRTDNPHGVTAGQIGADPAGSAAAVQQAMAPLLRFQAGLGNEYVWAKTHITQAPSVGSIVAGAVSTLHSWIFQSYNKTEMTIQYADSIISVNGVLQLSGNVTTVTTTKTSYPSATTLRSKYVYVPYWNWYIYVGPSANILADFYDGDLVVYVTQYADVTLASHSEIIEYVNSSSPEVYPVPDGYTYFAYGKVGDLARTLSGVYIGTGVAKTISVPSTPRMVLINNSFASFSETFGVVTLSSYSSAGVVYNYVIIL